MRRHIPKLAGAAAVVSLLALPFVYDRANYDYVMHLWITAFFYAILASSWSLLAGYAGQFSFGHMAFMAVGAYGTGLFSNYFYFTSAPTNTCFEIGLGARYLVVLDPIGVSAVSPWYSAGEASWRSHESRQPVCCGSPPGLRIGRNSTPSPCSA